MDSAVGDSHPPARTATGGIVGPGATARPGSGPGASTPGAARRGWSPARLREHPRAERWTRALLVLATVVLLAATLEIVLDAAVGHSALLPDQPKLYGWLGGIGERLGYRVFLIALIAFTCAYALMISLARGVSKRWAIVLVAALQLIVFVGPVLISTDVFSYIAYARMGVEHGINPYTHGPIAIVGDPIYKYVGHDWLRVATAYGPLYTLLSYPLAPLGVTGALWGMKAEALLASAGTLALTWRCARIRGFDPALVLLIVGANPLWVIYGLGGAHNDLIMTLFMMGAVTLSLAGRDASAAASVIAGTLVKATVAALLPFMILAHRKLAPILGALAALVLAAVVGYGVFGIHGIDLIAALNRDAAFVSTDSFPNELAHLVGKPGVFPVDHDLLKAGLVLIVLYLLWRTWRGYDWIAASGWTLLAISVTSTWLLPWYTLWSLPLAVVVRDRRLLAATLAIQALYIVHQMAPILVPVK